MWLIALDVLRKQKEATWTSLKMVKKKKYLCLCQLVCFCHASLFSMSCWEEKRKGERKCRWKYKCRSSVLCMWKANRRWLSQQWHGAKRKIYIVNLKICANALFCADPTATAAAPGGISFWVVRLLNSWGRDFWSPVGSFFEFCFQTSNFHLDSRRKLD